jgi:hypothetical protein
VVVRRRSDRGRAGQGVIVLPGVLATIDDDVVFAGASLETVAGTVCWPNGIDLDPDVLHGDHAPASAVRPRLLREYRLQQTG